MSARGSEGEDEMTIMFLCVNTHTYLTFMSRNETTKSS